MEIKSTVFENNGNIPAKYSCEGEGINPELLITGVPAEAKVLVLIMDDPDAPKEAFTHWLVWNIPANTIAISEGNAPAGATEGRNGAGKQGYIGPCPPPGGPHHYFFKLYALDEELGLGPDASKKDLEAEIGKHQVASAELVGLFAR